MGNSLKDQHYKNMDITPEMLMYPFEAESVAYVVSMRLGLDTSRYSVSYIKSWLKDKDELKIVADTVQKVAAKIINSLAESSDSAFSDLREESEDKENE